MARKPTTDKLQEDLKRVADDARMQVMAVVGATDLAVEKVRDAQERLVEAAKAIDAKDLPKEFKKIQDNLESLQKDLADVVSRRIKDVQGGPADAIGHGIELASKAHATVEELAERGEDVIARIRNQKPTKELKSSVKSTVKASKSAVTSAKKAAIDTEKAAVKTLKTAGKEARTVAEKVGHMVERDAKEMETTVKASTRRTRAAATRTTTTAKTGAKRTTTRAKAVGIEIDPARVAAAAPLAREGLEFRVGGFEVPLPDGAPVTVIRACNVLRQYDENDVADAWSRLRDRLTPEGIVVDGTCDELGRVATWVCLDREGPRSLTLSLRLAGLASPAVLAERLPKVLIHRNVPGEPVHTFLTALEQAWAYAAPHAAYGMRARFVATAARLAADGWPLTDGRSRWRLGEFTVDWSAVAPGPVPR